MSLGEEKVGPDFLPKKPHSWEDLRVAVRKNLDATLGLVDPLPAQDISLSGLENTDSGTYFLKDRPTVSFMKKLPDFRGGEGEVGLFCIKGRWFISLNDGLETSLPDTLSAVQHDGIFQADIHSHPGDDQGAEQPSREDISKLNSTIDGKNYIISKKGLIEFQKPKKLPGGFTNVNDTERAWRYWIVEELKLSEEEFNKRGGWELKKEFYIKYFGLRTIPWEKETEIASILAAKEKLVFK